MSPLFDVLERHHRRFGPGGSRRCHGGRIHHDDRFQRRKQVSYLLQLPELQACRNDSDAGAAVLQDISRLRG
jgi:hypothetical protein